MEQINKLFATDTLYVIPKSQRGYAWGVPQAKDLLNDVRRAGRLDVRHFFGSVFLQDYEGEVTRFGVRHEQAVAVQDGQQRITTIAVLLLVIYNRLMDLGSESHALEIKPLIFRNERSAHGLPSPRLRNASDPLDGFLCGVFRGDGVQASSPPMRRLEDVKSMYEQELRNATVDDLSQIATMLMHRCYLVVARLDAKFNKALVFDTINSRGLSLSVFDRIKNFAMHAAEVGEVECCAPEDSWYACLEELDRAELNNVAHEDALVSEAMSVSWGALTKPGKAHERFTEATLVLVDPSENADTEGAEGKLQSFVDAWLPMARGYARCHSSKYRASLDVNGDNTMPSSLRVALDRIWRMDLVGIGSPLISAAIAKGLPCDDIESLASLWEKYLFRVHCVGSRRTDFNSKGIVTWAHRLMNDTPTGILMTEIANVAKEESPLRVVRSELANGRPKYNGGSRAGWDRTYYFLYEYEVAKLNQSMALPVWHTVRARQKTSQEHIMPQTVSSGWEHWEQEQHAEYVDRLGNLVLTSQNSQLGNRSWAAKKSLYSQDQAMIREKELVHYECEGRWAIESIEDRERHMVDWAIKRWAFSGESE